MSDEILSEEWIHKEWEPKILTSSLEFLEAYIMIRIGQNPVINRKSLYPSMTLRNIHNAETRYNLFAN
jgi:hypothetical protein